ncbi:MAG: HD domain-containing protein [Flavobacteriales bacterium]|nr:HD domain-containing protein [Flavobacteriales bacterium]
MEVQREAHLQATRRKIEEQFSGEGTGHDWHHIARVRALALEIARLEGADLFITEMGALLHDIADHKFHGGDDQAGPREARRWMAEIGVPAHDLERIVDIVHEVTFKGAGVPTPMSTLEGKCVQDADRMDAIGAIGIARAFAYGGSKKRALYDPDWAPELHDSFDQYKSTTAPTINHFYEKLLLLRDRMNTETGKRMAAKRHEYMEGYLDQFYAEWRGER